MANGRRIHVGVGGWDYEPWRGTFYPPGLPKAKQLEHAGRHLTATEINATFYRLQKPEHFARWAAAVPEGFRFAVKASRFCTNRKNLAEGGEGVARFCAQGLVELGEKLGPILWQLAPTKRFDADELRAFFALLPRSEAGVELRHAIEARHESFNCAAFVELAREAGVGIAVSESDDYPLIADLTADFVYARLQGTREEEELGYSPAELDRWAETARAWARGDTPDGLSYVCDSRAPEQLRDVHLFVIGGAKYRNPAAAAALIERVSR